MARRKPSGARVSTFEIEKTRPLLTFGTEHPVWWSLKETLPLLDSPEFEGSIVRLRPPADATTETIEEVKKGLARAGAARIKLETRRGAVLPTEAVDKGKPTRSSAREVVEQLVAEANSADPEGLRDLVEKTMSEEGL